MHIREINEIKNELNNMSIIVCELVESIKPNKSKTQIERL